MGNMHVWPSFFSGKIVWFSDLCAGGLYIYDCECGEVYCEIKPDVLLRHGIFRVEALISWKSFVFIFSDRLNGTHVVYDKLKGDVKRLGVLKDEEDAMVHKAVLIGEILYLIPVRVRGYIYEMNLAAWNEAGVDSVEFVKRRINNGSVLRTWLPKSDDQRLYIPEYGGKRVFCIEKSKIKIIEFKIPSALNTIGVLEEELWAVPLYGEYIFCLTRDGIIKEKIKIPDGCTEDGMSDIWEIIPGDEFVFLIHWRNPKIDIYNRKTKETIQIDGKMFMLPAEGDSGDEVYYLPYVFWKNVIHFFPSRGTLLEIEMPNMAYRFRKSFFPANISLEEWDKWQRIVRKYRYSLNINRNEKGMKYLYAFLECMSEELFLAKDEYKKRNFIGEKIYQYISENNRLREEKNEMDE